MDFLSERNYRLMIKTLERNTFNSLKLEIQLNNYCVLDESWKQSSCRDPFSRLYFVRQGNGWVKYKNRKVPLEGGRVYLIPSYLDISYGCTELEKIFFHITVHGYEKTDLLSSFKDIYSLPFSEEDFSKLLSSMNSDNYIDMLNVKQILYVTVTDFFNNFYKGKIPVKNYSDTVKKTMNYIQKHLSISLTSSEIAQNLFLSQTKIRTAFKNETGMTIGDYIDDLIFSQISNLLINEKIPIAEISRRFGFCDAYYLSRRFKEKYNQTPSQFRKLNSL